MPRDKYNGLLTIDKPSGMTSHDVVDALRKIFGQRRVGHTGTLDPMATGLLLICLGNATKAAGFITGCDKRYRAELQLGRTSSTYDAEGIDDSPSSQPIPALTTELIEEVFESFRGTIEQKVPPHSAVHVDGKRLYKHTRAGVEVELPTRQVHIAELKLLDMTEDKITIEVNCSSGTYIRSLAHDIGQKLGCGAYLANLRRISIGNIVVDSAITLEDVTEQVNEVNAQKILIPLEEVLGWSSLELTDSSASKVVHGQCPRAEDIVAVDGTFRAGDRIFLKDSVGQLLALARTEVDSDSLMSAKAQALCSFDRVLV